MAKSSAASMTDVDGGNREERRENEVVRVGVATRRCSNDTQFYSGGISASWRAAVFIGVSPTVLTPG